MVRRIDNGLNFFGLKSNYAPERAWTTTGEILEQIMKRAKDENDNINNILSNLNLVDVLAEGFSEVQKVNTYSFEDEIKETNKLIELQQSLKKKTIEVIHKMTTHYTQRHNDKTFGWWCSVSLA